MQWTGGRITLGVVAHCLPGDPERLSSRDSLLAREFEEENHPPGPVQVPGIAESCMIHKVPPLRRL